MAHGWEDISARVAAQAARCREPARRVKLAVAGVLTDRPAGYYYHASDDLYAVFAAGLSPASRSLCKSAAARAGRVRPTCLTVHEAGSGNWIKVAYSPALRRGGELLNFFPGHYPGGIPNAPGPLAAMLTTALVGGGLGYGLGSAVEPLMPHATGRKLKRTGAILGAALGAAPGAAWGYANLKNNHGLADPWPLDEALPPHPPGADAVPLTDTFKAAAAAFAKEAFGHDAGADYADVDVNALGQVLWQSGASPQVAGTTMAAMYAARQMPDPRGQPGIVTAGQLGQLALNAGKNYLTGALVGAALNTVIGTPISDQRFGQAAAALGVIKTVVPKLFS